MTISIHQGKLVVYINNIKQGITLEYQAGEKTLCSKWLLATWLQYNYHA